MLVLLAGKLGCPGLLSISSHTQAQRLELSRLFSSSDLGPQTSSHDCVCVGRLRAWVSFHVETPRRGMFGELRPPHCTRAEATHRPSLAVFFISIAPEGQG